MSNDEYRAEQARGQNLMFEHVLVVSGPKGGEFCGRCGLHWTDECHIRSSAIGKGEQDGE